MSERTYLLPRDGQWYKANMHSHTVISDGHWTPEQAKAAYQAKGYSVLAFTDHNRYRWHRELCEPGFLALAAAEMNIDCPMPQPDRWDVTPVYHLNFYQKNPETAADPPLPALYGYSVAEVNDYIAAMRQQGFLCCYNHPDWSLQTEADYLPLQNLSAFEIFNYGCEAEGLYGYAPRAYDALLRAGHRIAALAGDDNHDEFAPGHPFCDSFGGWTMIKAPALSNAAILTAVERRHCYAGNGPELHALYVQDGALQVECGPVAGIYVHGAGRKVLRAAAAPGQTITAAGFPLTGREPYLWVELRDAQNHFAASSAYFNDELFPI